MEIRKNTIIVDAEERNKLKSNVTKDSILKKIEQEQADLQQDISRLYRSLKELLLFTDVERLWVCLYNPSSNSFKLELEVLKKGEDPFSPGEDFEIRVANHVFKSLSLALPVLNNKQTKQDTARRPEHQDCLEKALITPLLHQQNVIGMVDFIDGEKVWQAEEVKFCLQVTAKLADIFVLLNRTTAPFVEDKLCRKILDSIPLPIAWKGRNLRFQGCNTYFEPLLNLAEKDVVGKTLYELQPLEYAEETEEIEKEMLMGGKAAKSTVRHIKSEQGESAWMRVTRTPLYNSHDEVTNIVVVYEDITSEIDLIASDSRHAKELKHALHQAQKANAAKTEFLSRMSHQIRTPLNAVIGLAQVALDNSDIDVMNDCLRQIQTASNSLHHIVNDLLDMSKIEADEMSIVNVSFDVDAMLQNVFEIITPLAEKREFT